MFINIFVIIPFSFDVGRLLSLRLRGGLFDQLIGIIHEVHLREKRRGVKKPGGNRLVDDEIVEPECFSHGIGGKVSINGDFVEKSQKK